MLSSNQWSHTARKEASVSFSGSGLGLGLGFGFGSGSGFGPGFGLGVRRLALQRAADLGGALPPLLLARDQVRRLVHVERHLG